MLQAMPHMAAVAVQDASTGIGELRKLLALLREHGCLEYEGPHLGATLRLKLIPLLARVDAKPDAKPGESFGGKSADEIARVLGPLGRGGR